MFKSVNGISIIGKGEFISVGQRKEAMREAMRLQTMVRN